MIIRADARALPLADRCVQMVCTSPPYFGLRSYPDDRQIGLEATPAAYLATLVQVFRELRRVLNDDGTVWLNLGDSYANDAKWGGATGGKHVVALHGDDAIGRRRRFTGAKAKDLLGIPWRVAFALQADGWYLRSDIIWHKPNPMPESVTDRPTKAHEYLFLLSKCERYFYDAAAIRESQTGNTHARGSGSSPKGALAEKTNRSNTSFHTATADWHIALDECRNKRSVWTVPTMPYSGAHFATMPEKLVEPCILAGCPLGGLVLDPFLGSGTVGAVAERLGRRWVGTDLSYQTLASARTRQRGLRFSGDVA